MSGWKTWTAGFSGIFFGMVMVIAAIVEPIVSVVGAVKAGNYSEVGNVDWGGVWTNMQVGIAFITGGLGVIGIGHKIEKGSAAALEYQAKVDAMQRALRQAAATRAAGTVPPEPAAPAKGGVSLQL